MQWTRRMRRCAAPVVVSMVALSLAGTSTGTAHAMACSGGPAYVFLGEGEHLIQANRPSAGNGPYGPQAYRVTNGSDSNVAVQVKGYDRAGRETWTGFPLGPNGAFSASAPWDHALGYPAIKVRNLGGDPKASVGFDC